VSGTAVIIERDDLSPLLVRLNGAAVSAGLRLVMGRAAGNLVKGHLYDLDAERHKYGRHYYRQAADSLTVRDLPEGVALSITQIGFRLRLLGAGGVRIYPRNGRKYLTIPAAPEAYGMRAREFHDLRFSIVLDENGALRPALVRAASTAISYTRRKRKDGTVRVKIKVGELREEKVMFWLVRSVSPKADPSVLPANRLIIATAVQAGLRRIERLQQRALGNQEN
jgi:hypothetical protein